ncbi:uncharacterized protein LOC135482470 [Lineus longissimus]|uniref:uncharacterized protein LOC135482470 n=1 Tax=Lineus longissimus TaxID=88925 RepID=UPI002B4C863E
MSVEQSSNSSTTDQNLLDPKGGVATIETEKQVCKFYSAGKFCKFGRRCRNLHQRPEKKVETVEITSESTPVKINDGTVKTPNDTPSLPLETLDDNSSQESTKTAQVKLKVCQYFSNYGRCRYGRGCRYEHSRPGGERRGHNPGNSRPRYGRKDGNQVRRDSNHHDDFETEDIIIQGSARSESSQDYVDNFAGLDVKDGRARPRRPVCRYFRNGHCVAGIRCRFLHPRTDNLEDDVPPQPQPGMIDLPPKNERRRPPAPRPPVQPVVPVSEYVLEEIDDEKSEQLRDTEISQLKKRIPADRLKELDESEFKIVFHPTDPDWPYDVKSLQFMVYFPIAYPTAPMQVMTPKEQEMPATVLSYIEYSMTEWVEKRFKEKEEGGKVELVFRPFLRWLDKTLEKLFTEGLKQLKKEIVAQGSGIECVPYWKLRVTKKAWKFEPETSSKTSSDDASETESDSEESDTESDEDEGEGKRQGGVLDPVQKGTQIKMRCLQLLEGIGTLTCMKVKVVVHCARCKQSCDLKLSANRAIGTTCTKCNHQMLVNFRPAMMHQMSHNLGYLDVDGCKASDIVLMDGIFDLSCISCSKVTVLKGLQPGAVKNLWCHSCHQKISLAVESTYFQELQAGSVDTSNMQVIRKKKKSTKDPTIQEGMPLPNFGTCKHYKKSFRWLRFPCCGMTYPCDVCHDDKEDHEMQYANRMICGFCSKEQGYAGERPCISCGTTMTKGTKTSHWEGGQGCRDKIKMSRSDQQKYANTNKTISRKSQQKGKQRPKTTKLRHV